MVGPLPKTPPERPADGEAGVAALGARARDDLGYVDHPAAAWRPAPSSHVDLVDVLVIGAGQSGLAVAFQLLRDKVENLVVVDRAPRGGEGPWRTFARMPRLRSPKDFNGPDLGVPSLTYRAWHEARFGTDDWQRLQLIPRHHWADYLDWFRDTLALPVRNRVAIEHLTLEDGAVVATGSDEAGAPVTFRCRRVVLATGLDGLGHWWMPPTVAALPRHLRAHAADTIDFAELDGKRVGVLGAGASAADNAASALEAGAAEVVLCCRRPELQRIQPYRWLTFAGFLRHLSDLDDTWRWRFMHHVMSLREGFPQDTYDRCVRHHNFRIATDAAWTSCAVTKRGTVAVESPAERFEFDYVIAGTGIDVDFGKRPELAPYADAIATWGDRYQPEPGLEDERLARYPYLGADFTFQEKLPGTAPILGRLHVFNFGATMSFGPSGSSINAMTTAVPKLAAGVTRGLFRDDVESYWQSLQSFDDKIIRFPGEA
ncbi:MAG: NAD(P)/FAD-dependent oxidoreductase [Pseudomonadota bacterium]